MDTPANSIDVTHTIDTAGQDSPEGGKFTRDMIREAILNSQPEVTLITVFKVKIEIKAPDLEGLLQYRGAGQDDTIMARSIVDHCYVPGTDEKVFDAMDVASLMKVKFTPDMKKLISSINKVLGMDETLDQSVKEESFPPEA